jgi:hypothetical protein
MMTKLSFNRLGYVIGNRAVFNTTPTSGTQLHIDTACSFFDLYLEISRAALHGFQIRIGDKFYVQMPADLDQFRGDNSHGTIICREGFIQLSHDASYGRAFFKEVDVISGVSQIKGGLHTGNSAPNDQNRSPQSIGHRSSPFS